MTEKQVEKKLVMLVSGHRPQHLGGYESENQVKGLVVQRLSSLLQRLHSSRGVIVVTGLKIGVDFWTAHICRELKIPYVVALTMQGMESKWSARVQEEFNSLLSFAAKAYYISDPPFAPVKQLIRNEWMIEKAERVLLVWDGKRSGTGHIAYKTMEAQKPLIRLNPETFKMSKVTGVGDDWTLISEE